jgi:hypothetical protein
MTIEKDTISWKKIANPHPTPNTRMLLIFSLMKKVPKVRPIIEFRSMPMMKRSVIAESRPKKLTQITPIDTLKTKITV